MRRLPVSNAGVVTEVRSPSQDRAVLVCLFVLAISVGVGACTGTLATTHFPLFSPPLYLFVLTMALKGLMVLDCVCVPISVVVASSPVIIMDATKGYGLLKLVPLGFTRLSSIYEYCNLRSFAQQIGQFHSLRQLAVLCAVDYYLRS